MNRMKMNSSRLSSRLKPLAAAAVLVAAALLLVSTCSAAAHPENGTEVEDANVSLEANASGLALGHQISMLAREQGREMRHTVEGRAFGLTLNRTPNKTALVEQRAERIQNRVKQIQERRLTLVRQLQNGTMDCEEFASEMAILNRELVRNADSLNETVRMGREMGANVSHAYATRGLNESLQNAVEAIRNRSAANVSVLNTARHAHRLAMRARSGNFTGPEISEFAHGLGLNESHVRRMGPPEGMPGPRNDMGPGDTMTPRNSPRNRNPPHQEETPTKDGDKSTQSKGRSNATPEAKPTELAVKVTDVVDGDTMDIEYPNGSSDTVRLLAVDTPETHSANEPEEFPGIDSSTHLRSWGEKATDFTSSWVAGERVHLQFDKQEGRRGRFGRLLAYVYVGNGSMLNRILVSKGYARVYEEGNAVYEEEFLELQKEARDNHRGLWGPLSLTPTPTSTESSGGTGTLSVARIHPDAEGNDHENLNDEYLVFENTGSGSIDLSGWSVHDEAGHTYFFPTGFTLESGEKVTLYTGSGTDSSTSLYWRSESAIWNNGGDTVFVEDDSGSSIIEKNY